MQFSESTSWANWVERNKRFMCEALKPVVMPVQKFVNLPQLSTAVRDEQAKKSILMICASRG